MKQLSNDEIKDIMLTILGVFHRFCVANNLKYSIWYGTAIGAIRHKGFIPWDDDIDVIMPRDDYEKFIRFYNNKNYCLYTDNNKNYKLPYAKLCDANTTSKSLISFDEVGVFIDIFPLDLVDKNSKYLKKICRLLLPMRYANLKKGNFVSPDYSSTSKKFVLLRKAKHYFNYQLISTRRFFSFYYLRKKKIMHYLKKAKGSFYSPIGCWPTLNEYMDEDIFTNMIDISFDGISVRLISNYDYYLRQMYGDYLVLPPKEQRETHSYYSFFRIN